LVKCGHHNATSGCVSFRSVDFVNWGWS
jgi:hypothetical protein